MSAPQNVVIVSSAHWHGDPRLNRHLEYLEAGGHDATFVSHSDRPRIVAMARALTSIVRKRSDLVVLPDPELFFIGSLFARLRGSKPVIDIHEDYPQAAMARAWVPGWARPLVRLIASIAVQLGRIAGAHVLVAAPELAHPGDTIVLNIPNPASMPMRAHDGSRRLVYVGDVTVARGAITMVEALSHLNDTFTLQIIGRVSPSAAGEIESSARRLGVLDRISLSGQLEHDEAWRSAGGALAGLNLLSPAPAYLGAVATKLWEYMSVGLPVIVSDLPGQARLVTTIHPDLVCRTPAEVAGVAIRLAEDPALRDSLAAAGRRLAETKWIESRPDLAVQSLVEP